MSQDRYPIQAQIASPRPRRSWIISGITIVLILVAAYFIFVWTVNRIYVPEGKSLLLQYRGPLLFGSRKEAKPGQFAEPGEIGVFEQMGGPGRHFYCPIWYERTLVDDIIIPPGHVGVVKSKMGEPLPTGEFLVDGELGETKHNGILRKVLAPGRYRVNPFAYDVSVIGKEKHQSGAQTKHSGWVHIPTGYVGVVTKLSGDAQGGKAGIREEVLPPGLYPINRKSEQVDIIEIGYRELSNSVTQVTDARGNPMFDDSGEPIPMPETGINFPSNDGFEIQMDFTAIWGVMPENAAKIIRQFGSIEAVENKVVGPQAESICRNNGSTLGAVELLIGESRQEFQQNVSAQFQDVLEEKGVSLLYGLVRHIYIPQQVRLPIQQSFIADELKLTRDQETLTAKTEATLREEERKVDLEAERVRVETDRQIASVLAEADREAKEIEAETQQKIAVIDRQAAELDAKKIVLLGQADAIAEKLQQEAKADKFRLAIEAFGGGEAYTRWQFAEGLPESMDLQMIYAGDGTLWTDMKGIVPTLPVHQAPTKRSN